MEKEILDAIRGLTEAVKGDGRRKMEAEILKELKRLNENFERFLQRHDLATPLPVATVLNNIRLADRTREQIKADNKIIIQQGRARLKRCKSNESE